MNGMNEMKVGQKAAQHLRRHSTDHALRAAQTQAKGEGARESNNEIVFNWFSVCLSYSRTAAIAQKIRSERERGTR